MLTNEVINAYFHSLGPLKMEEKIEKGFSGEDKYIISNHEGVKFLLRIDDLEKKQGVLEHYEILKLVSTTGIPMTRPVDVAFMEKEKKVAVLLTYVEGIDGEEILPSLSEDIQYHCGLQAGKVLRGIHSVKPNPPTESWQIFKTRKNERYEAALYDIKKYYDKYQFVVKYIQDHLFRLEGRPSALTHDDFHPANLIIHNNTFAGVIDFNRFEWADPIHDFHKIALFTRNISIPFSNGQIHGYFDGDPGEEFWHLYTLYAAMIVTSAMVWSYKVTPHLVDDMEVRVDQILEDHQQLQSSIPSWYLPASSYIKIEKR
ncbi:aminoglycoside phosphotransferase family protein [Cytobacillus sp. FJAT-54145]|uniref:Aminoglycoside phosphotransferase family protein n=1 Tax=Cytobacillus spartinae TaxID=3299023 RepID=A0ABW6KGR2_9BACI